MPNKTLNIQQKSVCTWCVCGGCVCMNVCVCMCVWYLCVHVCTCGMCLYDAYVCTCVHV